MRAGSRFALAALALEVLFIAQGRAAMVQPDDPELVSENATYAGAAADISAYVSRPKKEGKYPAVIVVHGNSGSAAYDRDVARRLAKEGYVAIAPDLLSRAGKTEKFTDREEAQKALAQIKREDIYRDLDSTFAYAEKLPFVRPERIGVVGFCWGGGHAFMMATRLPKLRAAAIFYGRNPEPLELVKNIRAELLVVHGETDVNLTRHVPQLEAALKDYGKSYEVKIYPGAGHAFHNDTSERSYHPEAARAAWQQTLSLFRRALAQ
ncbi:MAG TPA: dienelactone hydrolase family protein [Candidatus Binatia bacterium]|jgi:carboxymethylenebutenolidase